MLDHVITASNSNMSEILEIGACVVKLHILYVLCCMHIWYIMGYFYEKGIHKGNMAWVLFWLCTFIMIIAEWHKWIDRLFTFIPAVPSLHLASSSTY